MGLTAGEFRSGGRIVDALGRDSLKAETVNAAPSAGSYISGGVRRDVDGRICVAVETLNAAVTAGTYISGGRRFDQQGRLVVAVSNAALVAGEVLSGGEITDNKGRVVVTNETLGAAYSAGDYNTGGGARSALGRRLVAGATGGAFDPLSIAGLAAWFKADAGTSTVVDGATISQWNDQSGNGRHATQATGGNQPQYKAAILNGLPVVRFGGAAFMDLAAFVLPGAYTVLVVALSSGGVLPESIFDADQNSPPRMFQFRFNTGALEHIAFNNIPSAFTDSQAATISAAHCLVGRVDPTTVQTWVDNTSDGSTALTGTANSVSAAIRIGAHAAGGAQMTGDIGEILYYDSALSTTDRQSVQTYLKTRWGTP